MKIEHKQIDKERNPLSFPVFRSLWVATVVSNIGTWMNDISSVWQMTALSSSPFLVASVQAATTFPMFLLALPSGALADIFDRRKILMVSQILGICAAIMLAAFTFIDLMTPHILLGITLMLGTSAALSAPAFQAIVPELVDKEVLSDAISLNSLGVNIARAIGPALGGLLIAIAGIPFVYLLNALSFLAVLATVFFWKRSPTTCSLPPEHFVGAIMSGFRYVRYSHAMKLVLIRTAGFFVFASAIWAMLPLVGRNILGLDAAGYGALLGFIGAGAILGAILFKRVRDGVSPNKISVVATLLLASATLLMSMASNFWTAAVIMVAAGLAWIWMITVMTVAVQAASASWVKARALAVYLLIFQGAMTGGSLLWGALAARVGIQLTLLVAACGLAISLILALIWRLPKDKLVDLAPSNHWAEPAFSLPPAHDRGPVLVQVEYQIDPKRHKEFIAALRKFRASRMRDGAIRWDVWEDIAAPHCVIEAFVVESWVEHKRQHERVTNTDQLEQKVINSFHLKKHPPLVRHFLRPLP